MGDSHDNALAETVIGLYKAELIRCPTRGPATAPPTWNWQRWDGSTGTPAATSATSHPRFEVAYAARRPRHQTVGNQRTDPPAIPGRLTVRTTSVVVTVRESPRSPHRATRRPVGWSISARSWSFGAITAGSRLSLYRRDSHRSLPNRPPHTGRNHRHDSRRPLGPSAKCRSSEGPAVRPRQAPTH